MYRTVLNKKLDIDFYGIPVEIYFEAEDIPTVSNGIYSVTKNDWIKEPVQEDIPEIDMDAFNKEFKKIEAEYNKIKDTNDSSKIDEFIEKLYDLRKTGLATDGEYSLQNLEFKEARNKGWLDHLKELKNALISKSLSLPDENVKVDDEVTIDT